MAWLVVEKDLSEWIYQEKPYKNSVNGIYLPTDKKGVYIELPGGSIFKLIGRKLTFEDDPVEI